MQRKSSAVLLLYGGAGREHEISCRSAANVLLALNKAGVNALPVGIGKDGIFRLHPDVSAAIREAEAGALLVHRDGGAVFPGRLRETGCLLSEGGAIPIRCALPILHGDRGEDGEIQGLLSAAGIPYIGCDTRAGALCADKSAVKAIASRLGIPTARWVVSGEKDPERARLAAEKELFYPLFCKPLFLGSSVGASSAPDRESFAASYAGAAQYGRVLVEEAVDVACELEVAYIGLSGGICTSPGAVVCDGCYSYDEKYGGGSRAAVLTDPLAEGRISESAAALCRRYAERLVSAAGLRDLSRIDFFLDRRGRVLFNEINTLPGLTEISLYPRLAASAGYPPEVLFPRLIALAEERGGERP